MYAQEPDLLCQINDNLNWGNMMMDLAHEDSIHKRHNHPMDNQLIPT